MRVPAFPPSGGTEGGQIATHDLLTPVIWQVIRSLPEHNEIAAAICSRRSSGKSSDDPLSQRASAKKLSQNTLIGEVKFLLPEETGAHLWARLRGMFSTAV